MGDRTLQQPFVIGGNSEYNLATPVSSIQGAYTPAIVPYLPPFKALDQDGFEKKYDITDYDDDFLYFGKEINVGGYTIERVDRQQVSTFSSGEWVDRETLVYS